MPLCLDVYIATSERTLTCIHRFLSAYADLREDAVRNDFEARPTGYPDGYVLGTLINTLACGLAQADRAFTLYFCGQPPNYRLGAVQSISVNPCHHGPESKRPIVQLRTASRVVLFGQMHSSEPAINYQELLRTR